MINNLILSVWIICCGFEGVIGAAEWFDGPWWQIGLGAFSVAGCFLICRDLLKMVWAR